MMLLNLGCGDRYCPDANWTNVDFVSAHPRVIAHDLRQGLPFQANQFDAVYHSHVLEHFTPADGRRLLDECRRVLKPGGILRVAVPDGEQICRLYLETLAKLEAGEHGWQERYDWMMLELYDQAVRTTSGGAMADYLRRPELPELKDKDFILWRTGNIGREIMESAARMREENRTNGAASSAPAWRRWARQTKSALGQWRQQLKLWPLNSRERQALALGMFRLSGEIHQWMYDAYSLRRAMEAAGLVDVRRCQPAESRIENWEAYHLDVDANGAEHAPSSVYLEGCKPA